MKTTFERREICAKIPQNDILNHSIVRLEKSEGLKNEKLSEKEKEEREKVREGEKQRKKEEVEEGRKKLDRNQIYVKHVSNTNHIY